MWVDDHYPVTHVDLSQTTDTTAKGLQIRNWSSVMPHMSVISACSDSVTLRSKDQQSSVQAWSLGIGPTWSNDCNDFLGRGKVCDRFWHHLGQHLLVHRVHCPTRPSLPIPLRWPSGHEAARPPNATCVNMSTQDAQGIDLMQNDAAAQYAKTNSNRTATEYFLQNRTESATSSRLPVLRTTPMGMREVVPGIQRIWVQIALRVSNQKATRWSNRNRQKRELHA